MDGNAPAMSLVVQENSDRHVDDSRFGANPPPAGPAAPGVTLPEVGDPGSADDQLLLSDSEPAAAQSCSAPVSSHTPGPFRESSLTTPAPVSPQSGQPVGRKELSLSELTSSVGGLTSLLQAMLPPLFQMVPGQRKQQVFSGSQPFPSGDWQAVPPGERQPDRQASRGRSRSPL